MYINLTKNEYAQYNRSQLLNNQKNNGFMPITGRFHHERERFLRVLVEFFHRPGFPGATGLDAACYAILWAIAAQCLDIYAVSGGIGRSVADASRILYFSPVCFSAICLD